MTSQYDYQVRKAEEARELIMRLDDVENWIAFLDDKVTLWLFMLLTAWVINTWIKQDHRRADAQRWMDKWREVTGDDA